MIPEHHGDIRDLKTVIPNLVVEQSKSWRDKYHGFDQRVVITQDLTPFQIGYQGPLALRLRARTKNGARRLLTCRVGQSVVLRGQEDWYRVKEWSPLEQPYYIGLDSNTMVYGPIRMGRLMTEGYEHYQTKHTSADYLVRKIQMVLSSIRTLGYTQVYLARPTMLSSITVQGVTTVDLKGYAEQGWKGITPSYTREETKASHYLRCRRRNLTETSVNKVEQCVQMGNIQVLYVYSSIDPKLFNHLCSLVDQARIQVIDPWYLSPTIMPQGFGLIKYFQ